MTHKFTWSFVQVLLKFCSNTTKKMKFSIKDFFIFCAVKFILRFCFIYTLLFKRNQFTRKKVLEVQNIEEMFVTVVCILVEILFWYSWRPRSLIFYGSFGENFEAFFRYQVSLHLRQIKPVLKQGILPNDYDQDSCISDQMMTSNLVFVFTCIYLN